MPEIADMLQEAYGSPWDKSSKIDYREVLKLKMPEESLTMVIDPCSYGNDFTRVISNNILKQTYKACGIPEEYFIEPPRRQRITPTHRLNPLLLLCN